MANLKYSSDRYQNKFDPKPYLTNYTATEGNVERYKDFLFGGQSDFWSNYKRRLPGDEVRCLEYGGGPMIATIIGAAPKVDRIVFAEHGEPNRQAVLSWLAGKPEAFDTKAVLKREEELKKKLKSVVSCDVHKSPIVDLEDVDKGQLFDVVTTSFCVEACVTSEEQFKSTVAKLCDLIKQSGYLRMDGVLEETFYTVAGERFYVFPVTKTMVEDAMKEAQMEDVKMDVMEFKKGGVYADGKFIFTVVGRKSDRQ